MKTAFYFSFAALTLALSIACGSGESENHDEENAVHSGEWESEEDEKQVHPDSLPKAVIEAVASRYPGAVIKEADEEKHSDGTIYYEVDLESDGGEIEALFSPLGEFLGLEEDRDAESNEVN